ncbi:MAG: class I SAM-dependent methyltransferase, partial [Bellilinea sp.]
MESYSAETYGERIAAVYDDLYSGYEEIAIHRLAQMAQGGRALEFGIGTGRIALPLQAMGVEVHGIDASPAMIEKLKAKPGGDRIQVLEGDFTTVEAQGKFSLVYIVFNTIFAPLTQ